MTRRTALLLFLYSLAGPPAAAQAPSEAGGDLIGSMTSHVVEEGETLLDIARDHDLGFVELRAANPGIDAWVPAPGTKLVLPTAHLLPEAPRGWIVINLAEQRLYFLGSPVGRVMTFPVGIGKCGWETPIGRTEIVGKREGPTWVPPPSIRAEQPELPEAVPPGPDNPLGAFSLDLGWAGYVIHGTNRPYGVGRRVSHGCIRLYPEDMEVLFPAVAVRTPVKVVDQPVKLGWSGGDLYLEVHPTQSQADEIEAFGRFTPARLPGLDDRVLGAAAGQAARLDWGLVREIAQRRRGTPVRVTR